MKNVDQNIKCNPINGMLYDNDTHDTYQCHKCIVDGLEIYSAHYFDVEVGYDKPIRWVIEWHDGELGREAIFPRWREGYGKGMQIAHSWQPRNWTSKKFEPRLQIMGKDYGKKKTRTQISAKYKLREST